MKTEYKLFVLELARLRKEQNALLRDYQKKLEELKIALIKKRIDKTE